MDTRSSSAHAINTDLTSGNQVKETSQMKTTGASNSRKVLKWSIALTIYYLIASIFFQDVGLHDESTFYLSQKDRLTFSSFLTGAEYGPLYAAWYKLLAVVVRDNIALYFVSWGLLVVLSVELMRRATQSIGSIVPVLITLAAPIFKVSPYVGLFTSIITLLGFIAVKNQKSANGAVIVIAISGLVAGLARPEFLYAPTMLLLGYTGLAIFLRQKLKTNVILLCAAIAASGIFISRNSDTGRSVVAFEQHFNLRASERGELGDEMPWTSKHAREVFFKGQDLDAKYKLSDYVKANPTEVVKHITRNAIDPRSVLLGLVSAAIAFFLYKAGQPFAAMYVAVMVLPPLISCVLIYPRNHYIVSILLMLIAGASIAGAHVLSGHEQLKRSLKTPLIVALALILFVFSLNIKALRSPPSNFSTHGLAALHPVASTLLELREIEQQHQFRGSRILFDPYGGFYIYMQNKWEWMAEFHVQSGQDFINKIRTHQASIFLVNQYTLDYFKLTHQEVNQAFRDGGYETRSCTYLDCTLHIAPHKPKQQPAQVASQH